MKIQYNDNGCLYRVVYFFCVCNKSEDCNVTVYRHFSLIDFDTVSLRTNCNQVKRSHLRVSAYRYTARASKKKKIRSNRAYRADCKTECLALEFVCHTLLSRREDIIISTGT